MRKDFCHLPFVFLCVLQLFVCHLLCYLMFCSDTFWFFFPFVLYGCLLFKGLNLGPHERVYVCLLSTSEIDLKPFYRGSLHGHPGGFTCTSSYPAETRTDFSCIEELSSKQHCSPSSQRHTFCLYSMHTQQHGFIIVLDICVQFVLISLWIIHKV